MRIASPSKYTHSKNVFSNSHNYKHSYQTLVEPSSRQLSIKIQPFIQNNKKINLRISNPQHSIQGNTKSTVSSHRQNSSILTRRLTVTVNRSRSQSLLQQKQHFSQRRNIQKTVKFNHQQAKNKQKILIDQIYTCGSQICGKQDKQSLKKQMVLNMQRKKRIYKNSQAKQLNNQEKKVFKNKIIQIADWNFQQSLFNKNRFNFQNNLIKSQYKKQQQDQCFSGQCTPVRMLNQSRLKQYFKKVIDNPDIKIHNRVQKHNK